jgi:hypothetical protein
MPGDVLSEAVIPTKGEKQENIVMVTEIEDFNTSPRITASGGTSSRSLKIHPSRTLDEKTLTEKRQRDAQAMVAEITEHLKQIRKGGYMLFDPFGGFMLRWDIVIM